MTGDAMKKVQPGDRLEIPAETFNTFIDTARAFRAERQNLGVAARERPMDHAVTRIRNDSGAARARHAVLGVSGVVFLPGDNLAEFLSAPVLKGVTPDADEHAGRFVVLLEPVDAGKIGLALAVGVTPVVVDMQSADHTHADVTDQDASQLTSAEEGAARILWAEAGTGQRRAVALLGGGGGGGSLPGGTAALDALLWNATDGVWEPAATTTVSVVTAVQKSAGKVQIKTRSVRVLSAEAESAWTDVGGQSMVTRTVLTGWRVDGLNFQTTSKPIYVDSAGGDSPTWITQHTGTECE